MAEEVQTLTAESTVPEETILQGVEDTVSVEVSVADATSTDENTADVAEAVSSVSEPVTEEGEVSNEVLAEPAADEPVADESVTDEPVAEESTSIEEDTSVVEDASVVEEDTSSNEVVVEAVEAPVADSGEAAAEVVAEAADEPVVDEPAADAPVADDSDSAASDADSVNVDDDDDENKTRVVRVLSVGQEIVGTVKRVTDFGAFVDIGVGRDGLIHISELSVRRIARASDVLKQDQEITAWIKKLDRDRNRISLTMIPPGTRTIRDLEGGEVLTGKVTRIVPYGAFVDIGVGRDALLHIREMSEGYVKKPEDVVSIDEVLEARIIQISRRRGRIDLSLKGLRPEPEPEYAPEQDSRFEQMSDMQPMQDRKPKSKRRPEPEPEPEMDPEDELLSPMELAFKRAMASGDGDFDFGGKEDTRRPKGKRSKRRRSRDLQDEILERTLSSIGNQ